MSVVNHTYILFCFLKLRWGLYSAVVLISSGGSHIGHSDPGLLWQIDALGRMHAFVLDLIWVLKARTGEFDFIGVDQASSALYRRVS